MSQPEFDQVLGKLDSLSEEQMKTIRRALDTRLSSMAQYGHSIATDEVLQNRLFEAGLLSEIKPPIRVPTGTEQLTPITIKGELL